jgi:hypothetical protein
MDWTTLGSCIKVASIIVGIWFALDLLAYCNEGDG